MNQFNQPALSIDALVFRVVGDGIEVLMAERWNEPFAGQHALPGVLLRENESIDQAARRAVIDKAEIPETAIKSTAQFRAFDNTNRDPRGLTISFVSWVFLNDYTVPTTGTWVPLSEAHNLPFDHEAIIKAAISELADPSLTVVTGILGDTFFGGDYAHLIESAGGTVDRSNLARVIPARFPVTRLASEKSPLTLKRSVRWAS